MIAVKSRHGAVRLLFLGLLLICGTHALAQSGAKRPITHADYDAWKSIQGAELSADGKYLACALVPEEGDGEIVVRYLATGKEWRHPRGSQPAPAPTPAAAAIRRAEAMNPGRPTDHHFTADGKTFVFRIFPAKAEVDKAKKANKKPEEMPKNAMGIMDLASGAVDRIERVKSFQVPEKGSGFIAYLREPPLDEKKSDRDTGPKHNQRLPVMGRQCAQRPNSGQNGKDPFRRDAQKELDVWVKRDERGENGEVERARAGESGSRAQTPERQDQRRHD